MLPEVVFILGAPGAGKGATCSFLSREYGFVHLSAGELLREEEKRPGSELGKMIGQKLRNGEILPFEVTYELLRKAMQNSGQSRFLIDGFPRNKENLDGWERLMSDKAKLLFVLFLECSQDICTERCLRRGAAGNRRSDDNLESLKKRFITYLNDTLPSIQHYDQKGLVRRIDAEVKLDAMLEAVKVLFDEIGLRTIAN